MSTSHPQAVWFVVDDRTLVQAYADDRTGRTVYARHTTTRLVGAADIEAAGDRFARLSRIGGRVSAVLTVVLLAGAVAVLVALVNLPGAGSDDGRAGTVLRVSAATAVVALVLLLVWARTTSTRYRRLWADVGFSLVDAQGLREREALPLVEAPGTVRVTT